MQQTVHPPSITFKVDKLRRATARLKECETHLAVKRGLSGAIESCSDYHGTVVKDIDLHPLLGAVHTAFSQYRPLVLTPDAVWITIAQGVAHHIAIHSERLRPRFVAHQGKLDLEFAGHGWAEGSPENHGWRHLPHGRSRSALASAPTCITRWSATSAPPGRWNAPPARS